MNSTKWFSITLTAAMISLFHTPSALAESDAVKQMAEIVINLNHQPSEADKQTLRKIAQNGSPAEITIANALINMEHSVGPTDKARLNEIVKDTSQPVNTRNLALILKDLNHTASSAEKEKLGGM